MPNFLLTSTDIPGFAHQMGAAATLWRGHPRDDIAHNCVLEWMQTELVTPLANADQFTDQTKGNLGEFLVLQVGRQTTFKSEGGFLGFPANTNPTAAISKPDVDVIWVHLGDDLNDDYAVLQEVKTTGDPALLIAPRLVTDYQKLFGTNPRLTLTTRLQDIARRLKLIFDRDALAKRVSSLAANGPQTASRIALLPTLVHESHGADPESKLILVRESLIQAGWSGDALHGWSIGLADIDQRLENIARGIPA